MSFRAQFFSLILEAMQMRKISATQIAQESGTHYTYIYNSIRKNANMTMDVADRFARGAGYEMVVSFVPLDPDYPELTGEYDSTGPMFSGRAARGEGKLRRKVKPESSPDITPSADTSPADAELAELESMTL